MKTEYIRIYSEEDLEQLLRVAEVVLQSSKNEYTKPEAAPLAVSGLLYVRDEFETARYIVSESLLCEDEDDEYDRSDPGSLFIEREVPDDYDDSLRDPEGLHNRLLALQIAYNAWQRVMCERYDINLSFWIDPWSTARSIATDIWQHIDPHTESDYRTMEGILDELNHRYIYSSESDDAPEVTAIDVLCCIARREEFIRMAEQEADDEPQEEEPRHHYE